MCVAFRSVRYEILFAFILVISLYTQPGLCKPTKTTTLDVTTTTPRPPKSSRSHSEGLPDSVDKLQAKSIPLDYLTEDVVRAGNTDDRSSKHSKTAKKYNLTDIVDFLDYSDEEVQKSSGWDENTIFKDAPSGPQDLDGSQTDPEQQKAKSKGAKSPKSKKTEEPNEISSETFDEAPNTKENKQRTKGSGSESNYEESTEINRFDSTKSRKVSKESKEPEAHRYQSWDQSDVKIPVTTVRTTTTTTDHSPAAHKSAADSTRSAASIVAAVLSLYILI